MQFDLCHYPPLTYYKFSEYLMKVIPDVLKRFLTDNYGSGTLHNVIFTLLQRQQTFVHIYIHIYFIKKDNVNL